LLQILIAKCLGRRICGHCGKNYNVADIFIPATDGSPAVTMPPLSPPPECEQHMQRRSDDTLEIIKKRLEVWVQMVHRLSPRSECY
jgi:adenylate kinase